MMRTPMWMAGVQMLAAMVAAASVTAVAQAQTFALQVEQGVSAGVPGPGAGFIEKAGGSDIYLMDVPAPMTLYFDEIAGSCAFDWKVVDPKGVELFFDGAMCVTDPGLVEATEAGIYTITVVGTGATTGAYAFKVWQVDAPQEFELELEQLVAPGLPLAGAGQLDEPGAVDHYFITLEVGMQIYAQELSGGCAVEWSMRGPSGREVFDDADICVVDPGYRLITERGEHLIEVDSPTGATGNYSFKIWLIDPPQVFPIAIEQTISNGNPAPGAGNLEEPGSQDTYLVDLIAGEAIFVDELTGGCGLQWRMTSPSGALIFDDAVFCNFDPGIIVPPETGTYSILVASDSGSAGTYSFRLWSVEEPQTFQIGLNQIVSNGVPAAGAGNLEEPASIDRYEIAIFAGTTVYFNEISGSCAIGWRATSPSGALLFVDNDICNADPGSMLLVESGTWLIEVFADPGAFGVYSFALNVVDAPDLFTIEVGDTVADGEPADGAGNLEQAGDVDVYLLDVAPGERICFKEILGSCGIQWSVIDGDGRTVFVDLDMCSTDPGQFTILPEGACVITVQGEGSESGTYSFAVLAAVAADLSNDCAVDGADISFILGSWGACVDCAADLDGDGTVGGTDLAIVLGAWNP